jgi:hypothetical protein
LRHKNSVLRQKSTVLRPKNALLRHIHCPAARVKVTENPIFSDTVLLNLKCTIHQL